MKTFIEIIKAAKEYSDQIPLQDAFREGARYAVTGKYYKENTMFPKVDEFETVDLHETLPPLASVIVPPSKTFGMPMPTRRDARNPKRSGIS